ncbi:polyadenylate-binding protein-interacting protein 2 [Anolis sagrei]|uniref:polyadenylate-binding protein-interacting protein 2 n=1 Tax=Anolis sagrei TaxID=38937 RepID=UPI0035225FCF
MLNTQAPEVKSLPAQGGCCVSQRRGWPRRRKKGGDPRRGEEEGREREREKRQLGGSASASLRPRRLKLRSATMKDPNRRSTSPNIINEDVIMNGHSHEDDNPFAEYMWMENEEEFNRQIEEELWEEEFIERCFQEMLEEEEEHEWFIPARDLPQTMDQIQDQLNDLVISDGSSLEDLVVKSNLNPNAKEFVPGVKY